MRGRQQGAIQPSPFTKVAEFDGLHPGLDFQVRGEPDNAWFQFVAYVTNDAGDEWVDAIGGSQRGQKEVRSTRSFRLARIKKNRKGEYVTRPHKIPKTNQQKADQDA